jgi:hypothetical protein
MLTAMDDAIPIGAVLVLFLLIAAVAVYNIVLDRRSQR